MPRFGRILAWLAIVAIAGCARQVPLQLEVGHHHVRLVGPDGWEHLDHGRQQVFRRGEAQLLLEDAGIATPAALVREIEATREVWRSGRERDALARVDALARRAPVFPSDEARMTCWSHWNSAMYSARPEDTAAIAAAFDTLVAHAAALPPVPLPGLARFVFAATTDTLRYEIASAEHRPLASGDWIEVATWSRVTHLESRRFACRESGGYLLVLAVERDPLGQARREFDALLGSIVVMRPAAP